VDPDAIQKDKRFSNDFKIELYFRDYCPQCGPTQPADSLCPKCKSMMKEDVQDWAIIR